MRDFFRGVNLAPRTDDWNADNTELALPNIPRTDITVTTEDSALSQSVINGIIKNPGFVTVLAQKKLAKETALAENHERCRAILAKGAMENVVALSMLETHWASMVPQAAARCKAIVDVFMVSTAERMRGF